MRRSAMPPPFNLPDIAVDILCWCLTRLRSAAQILEDCKQAEQLRKEEQALLMLALTLAWSGRGREKLRLGSLQPRQSSNMIQSGSENVTELHKCSRNNLTLVTFVRVSFTCR